MRLPSEVHAARPWRIHEIASDFRLEDVWALPTPGGPDDFAKLVELAASYNPSQSTSPVVRGLFAVRWKLGALFGWDSESTGVGARVPTSHDRLPADLRDGPTGPMFTGAPFTPLYLHDNEWAAEVANSTMHGVLHLGWVEDGAGGYRGEMAVYVKPNGMLGRAYMAAILPFRHFIVYPSMLDEIGRRWRARPRSDRTHSDAGVPVESLVTGRAAPGRRRRRQGRRYVSDLVDLVVGHVLSAGGAWG
jgi:Protein of unknown function (DUF2867)